MSKRLCTTRDLCTSQQDRNGLLPKDGQEQRRSSWRTALLLGTCMTCKAAVQTVTGGGKGHFCSSIRGRSSHFQTHFVNSLSGLVGLLVFKLSLIFPLEQAVLISSERFPLRKRVWRHRCRYLKLLQVIKRQGDKAKEEHSSGAVGIGVCEAGSLVEGAFRSWGNRRFQRGDRWSSVAEEDPYHLRT